MLSKRNQAINDFQIVAPGCNHMQLKKSVNINLYIVAVSIVKFVWNGCLYVNKLLEIGVGVNVVPIYALDCLF